MSGNIINLLALFAAVIVGYGVFIGTGDTSSPVVSAPPIRQGYYLKNAVITETAESGAPELRLSAADVQQNPANESVELKTVKVDYLARATQQMPATRWEMTAARGYLPENSETVDLSGNVVARTLDASRSITLSTPALTVNTERQSASTDENVAVDYAGHEISGRGLTADLPQQRLRLGEGVLRLAEEPTLRGEQGKINLPDVFDHERLELKDGGIRLIKVRSRTEPLVQADEATASSTDLDNNRFVLRGNVQLDLPEQGSLRADSAVVTVRNGRIVHAVASGRAGEPVQFEHRRTTLDKQTNESKVDTARGHADTIDYDVPTSLLAFKGDVWFSTGRFQWRGEDWQYNLIDGSGSTGHRSTTTINPRSADKSNP